MNEFHMSTEFAEEVKNLRLPQFVIPLDIPMLTNDTTIALELTDLAKDFTLRGKDASIDFLSIDAEIAEVDIENDKNAPKAWLLSGRKNDFYRDWFNSLPSEKKIANCKREICKILDKSNHVTGIAEYVDIVVASLSPEQLEDLLQTPYKYAEKIRKKIDNLLLVHQEKIFDLWREQGIITTQPLYSFPPTITPIRHTQTIIANSLYTSEADMNNFEEETVMKLVSRGNIRWWHRNISRKGFCINGFDRAYPDIIAMTKSGMILIIETKGDHLENSESERKCRIGREWANLAGANYRYYMTFKEKDLKWKGAVRLDGLLEIVQGL
jgi:type III restriction enzyme